MDSAISLKRQPKTEDMDVFENILNNGTKLHVRLPLPLLANRGGFKDFFLTSFIGR